MKRTKRLSGMVLVILLMSLFSLRAQVVDIEEARTIAENWIDMAIYYQGRWGGADEARVSAVREFRDDSRLLGYLCPVEPRGYVLVSLVKGLAPVKAYSTSSNLDHEATDGPTELFRFKMASLQRMVEDKLGPVDQVTLDELRGIAEIDYRPAWDMLSLDAASFRDRLMADADRANYQAGGYMMTTAWHQGDPFFRLCPEPPPGSPCTAAHCAVGCTATGTAQIMRHWSWPPSDIHFCGWWFNMSDTVADTSSVGEIEAVSLISGQVGGTAGMHYCDSGCKSGVSFEAMKSALETVYQYSTGSVIIYRRDFTWGEWWNNIVAQLNVNRPILYAVLNHAIVCDGYGAFGNPPVLMYHMNYGWMDGHNDWYILDALHYPAGGGLADEYMMINIVPQRAVEITMFGTYYLVEHFPYRYFTTDCVANFAATFEAGQNLQLLPNIVVSCNNEYVRFESTDSLRTQLFSNGDRRRGIVLSGGVMKMLPGGGIKFSQLLGL